MLRDHARHGGRKLVHVAQAVLDGHLLLPPKGTSQGPASSASEAAKP